MLKNRITAEDFEKLSDEFKAHYAKSSDGKGDYLLQTEEASTLKRSLNSERTRADTATKLLRTLMPDLKDDNRDDWEDLVSAEAERQKEIRDAGFDLDEWKALKAEADDGEGGGGKKGKSKTDELSAQLLEAQRKQREDARKIADLERDKKKADDRATRVQADNDRLVLNVEVSRALDAARILAPEDREIATALLERKGIILRDTGTSEEPKREAFVKVDGQEVPLVEHTKDWASTDAGKRFVKAPDNAGVGDGPSRQHVPPTREQFQKLDPVAKLTSALEESAASRPAAAAR